MPSGELPRVTRKGLWFAGLLAALLALALPSAAIDNPDLPDYVAAFAARDHRERSDIDNSPTPEAVRAAYASYERFLQGELDAALTALRGKVADSERRRLDAAQRRWLAWRDAEGDFITQQWTNAAYGSSAGLSRQAYRTALLRDRVKALLQYLKDQPA